MIKFIEKIIKWFEETLQTSELPLTTKGLTISRKLQFFLLKIYFVFKRHQGLIIRAIISWSIGLLALHLDEVSNYDFRLSLRGDQSPSHELIIIELTPLDIRTLAPLTNEIRELKEDSPTAIDSRYWSPLLWRPLLTHLFKLKPKAVIINMIFDERAISSLSPEDWNLFEDSRLIWMGALSQSGKVQLPPFANGKMKNYGFVDFLRDEDGIVRSMPAFNPFFPSLPFKMAERYYSKNEFSPPFNKKILNFRGGSTSFRHLSVGDIILNKSRVNKHFLSSSSIPETMPPTTDWIDTESINDKIVIVGFPLNNLSQNVTPVGNLSTSELIAHTADNLIHKRWIKRLPIGAAVVELFLVMLLSVFLLNYFPQKVAFVFLSFLSLSIVSLSIWFFDTFNFWTPAFSPLIQIMGTWSLFVGYIASKIEHKNWQLEQEKKSLAQLEQLKNNFVSLISHDLKTPIAKIQAIADRLLLNDPTPEITNDLKSLRSSSNELNRYIQSVLKILRVESKDFHLNKEVVDINDLLNSSINQISPLALEKKITIKSQLEPLFSIEVDPILIQEVFINILENAIKYTPSNGNITVETQEIDEFIQIRVIDTGEGISPEDIEAVFGKFVRGKNQDLKTKGTGLGLYLVKYFIELHGGKVSLTSQLGSGTAVELLLPIG